MGEIRIERDHMWGTRVELPIQSNEGERKEWAEKRREWEKRKGRKNRGKSGEFESSGDVMAEECQPCGWKRAG